MLDAVDAVLVREGLARVSARVPLARLDELRRAEAEAQAFRRGMWGDTPQIPTAGYTRRQAAGGAQGRPLDQPQTFAGGAQRPDVPFAAGGHVRGGAEPAEAVVHQGRRPPV